jgi:SAM-dependent methyltransferase
VTPGTTVLDVGCGVGRWSCRLAARGAQVTGIDISPTMIAQARRRASSQGLEPRCRFLVEDLTALDTGARFDLILGVTVLQHILEPCALSAAVSRMVDHLAAGGTLVLLEAAPARSATACDSAIFCARKRERYLQLFADCGLRVRALRGVDPAPFKTWLLPHLRSMSRPLRLGALAAVTAASLPIDLLFGRIAAGASWHAVFVLSHGKRS